jgi:hypothetical protein
MNLTSLHQIIGETTQLLRKGPMVEQHEVGSLQVTTLDFMPHQDEVASDGVEKCDMELVTVGVDKAKAETRKAELVALLNDWPFPNQLQTGPSYITIGATIGDQGAALCLMALGKVLGLWSVVGPATFGLTGQEARDAAGSGFLMIGGWQPEK